MVGIGPENLRTVQDNLDHENAQIMENGFLMTAGQDRLSSVVLPQHRRNWEDTSSG